jgi:hypothetical protein
VNTRRLVCESVLHPTAAIIIITAVLLLTGISGCPGVLNRSLFLAHFRSLHLKLCLSPLQYDSTSIRYQYPKPRRCLDKNNFLLRNYEDSTTRTDLGVGRRRQILASQDCRTAVLIQNTPAPSSTAIRASISTQPFESPISSQLYE